MRRRGFFVVVTKKAFFLLLGLLLLTSALVWGRKLIQTGQRYFYGVKTGVCLEGYQVERLLQRELYDVVTSIAENHEIDAQNATWDWEKGSIQAEVVGQVVDVPATVETLLAAAAYSKLSLVTVSILPSITSAHFRAHYRGPATKPQVALMINVDWGEEFIPGMLAVFKERHVRATWFPTGSWVAKQPQLAQAIALANHEIGNHGGWHGLASTMGRQETARLIKEGEDKIVAATGQKPQLFAPPAGDFNQQTVAIAAEMGYKTVLWTVDTVDWQRPQPTVIVDRVLSKIENGALVLMHPTKPTLEALPVILEHLDNLGLECVTVSELLQG